MQALYRRSHFSRPDASPSSLSASLPPQQQERCGERRKAKSNSNSYTMEDPRIPTTLQSVFLASNRGHEVHDPPPDKAASKVFSSKWFFKRSRKNLSSSNHNVEQSTHAEPSVTKPAKHAAVSNLSPQGYLDAMIRLRGYSTKRYKVLESAYYNKPTPLQKASHHIHLVELIRANDHQTLKAILSSGISPNPCNQHGESLLHMVCRRGDHQLLQSFIQSGSSVQVADDYGRTPLHDACWVARPSFETVLLILKKDPRLVHMVDSHGATPLSYVHKTDWAVWIEFLDSIRDEIWPKRDIATEGEQPRPPLTLFPAESRPLRNPVNALPLDLAGMVASGRMSPEEAQFLKTDKEHVLLQAVDDYLLISETEFDQCSHNSVDTFDEGEMADILDNLTGKPTSKPVAW